MVADVLKKKMAEDKSRGSREEKRNSMQLPEARDAESCFVG
jgi:hypothetical protein